MQVRLQDGPLSGQAVEVERGGRPMVAFQRLNGVLVIVSSPWSTTRVGRAPVKGLEVEVCTYHAGGAFMHEGSDTACTS